jgi:hypothetical protein
MDDHEPLEPHDLLERIDACRDSDDLRDEPFASLAAELAADSRKQAIWNSVRQLDQAVVEAMDQVPVPTDLQERLLAALAAGGSLDETPASGNIAPAAEDQPQEEPAPAARSRFSRRQWLWTAASVATAASVGGVGVVASRYWLGQQLSPSRVLDETIAFYSQEVPEALETRQPPPRSLPFSSAISRNVRYLGWRRVNNFLGRPNLDGVAHEMTYRGAAGTLYVVPASIDSLKTWPLTMPDATTAGRSMSVWQGRNVMYVLVVDGGAQAYRGFVRQSGVV